MKNDWVVTPIMISLTGEEPKAILNDIFPIPLEKI